MNAFDIDNYTTQLSDPSKSLYVVIYDIPNNRTRYRVAKLLAKYGFRIQRSAFEVICNRHSQQEIIQSIEKLIHKQEDLVRLYRLCGNDRVYSFGNVGKNFEEDVVIY